MSASIGAKRPLKAQLVTELEARIFGIVFSRKGFSISIVKRVIPKDQPSKLTAEKIEGLEVLKNLEIDFSDAPEQLDWGDTIQGQFNQHYLPVDNAVCEWLQKDSELPEVRLNESLHKLISDEG